MEYHGPGFDYSDQNDRKHNLGYWLEGAYPFVMPLIIIAVGACLAVATSY